MLMSNFRGRLAVLNLTSIFLPNSVSLDRAYTLSDDISAMQILPFGDSGVRLSPSRGCRVEPASKLAAMDSMSKRLKVCYEGQFYFVFLQDLETQKKLVAMAARG